MTSGRYDNIFLEAISYHGRRSERQLVQLAAFHGIDRIDVTDWLNDAEDRQLVERLADGEWRIAR